MRITEKVLLAMGASKPTKAVPYYVLAVGGHEFRLRRRPKSAWEFYGDSISNYHAHMATDIEELISFAYGDGFEDGRDSKQAEILGELGAFGR